MVLIILAILTLIVVLPINKFNKNKRIIEERQIAKAYEIINSKNKNEFEIITKEEQEINGNVIGLLEIPKLGLIAPIQEGTEKEILKVAVGHFRESSFWNGNVVLASHNRSQYAHYFERINELQKEDEVIYKTKMGTRKYVITEIGIVESTDWKIVENTDNNVLTMITCVKNNPKKRFYVRGKEIIN